MRSNKSANSPAAYMYIFANKKEIMKNHILFSNKNWKQELRKNIETERNRAMSVEREIQKEITFLQDEIADAFTEISDEQKRVNEEIQRSTECDEQLQKNIDTAEAKISTETSRAQSAENKIRACIPVRFDGILTVSVTPRDELPESINAILYCAPLNCFVARSDSGEYYNSWENKELYMSNNSIHKGKIYICGSKLYVWNENKLSDITESLKTLIEELSAKIAILESKIK